MEIRKRNTKESVDYTRTSEREVTFYNLQEDTEYSLYIDNEYIKTFRLRDQVGESNAMNGKVLKKTATEAEISWSGTTGEVFMELRRQSTNTKVDIRWSNSQKVLFTNLVPDTEYAVYNEGKQLVTFRTDKNDPVSTIQPGSTVKRFTDIQEGHWAKEAIDALVAKQIISGYEDGSFRPSYAVTREQYVTMLVRSQNFPLTSSTTAFTDVKDNYWSAPYISAAIRSGVVVPAEYGGKFEPQKVVTREEMVIMAARALGLQPSPDSIPFRDKQVIKNKEIIGAAVREGLISGYRDGTFRPKEVVVRATAAQVIYNMTKVQK